MTKIRAAVVRSSKLTIETFDAPTLLPSQALIQVHAISLNRGEVKGSYNAADGVRPGWDFSGVVLKQAADGSGPGEGARVVGMLASGSWAEQVAAPTSELSALPDGVSFTDAATLPVAGLTAIHALYKGGFLLGANVLVTGATGGVGDFALQLAKLSGANPVAWIRKAEQEAQVRESGAVAVVVGDEPENLTPLGRYALVVESIGGATLGKALSLLDVSGTVVNFGVSGGVSVTFDDTRFFPVGGASFYGLILFHELKFSEPGSVGLAKLASLVDKGLLRPRIGLQTSWQDISSVAQSLLNREYPGKAVLTLD